MHVLVYVLDDLWLFRFRLFHYYCLCSICQILMWFRCNCFRIISSRFCLFEYYVLAACLKNHILEGHLPGACSLCVGYQFIFNCLDRYRLFAFFDLVQCSRYLVGRLRCQVRVGDGICYVDLLSGLLCSDSRCILFVSAFACCAYRGSQLGRLELYGLSFIGDVLVSRNYLILVGYFFKGNDFLSFKCSCVDLEDDIYVSVRLFCRELLCLCYRLSVDLKDASVFSILVLDVEGSRYLIIFSRDKVLVGHSVCYGHLLPGHCQMVSAFCCVGLRLRHYHRLCFVFFVFVLGYRLVIFALCVCLVRILIAYECIVLQRFNFFIGQGKGELDGHLSICLFSYREVLLCFAYYRLV